MVCSWTWRWILATEEGWVWLGRGKIDRYPWWSSTWVPPLWLELGHEPGIDDIK